MDDEILKLQRLAITLEKTKMEYLSKKEKMEKSAEKSHFARVNAENQALFFEDLLAHTNNIDLSKYFPVKPIFNSVEEGKNKILLLMKQLKEMPKPKIPLELYRQQINDLASKVQSQHAKLEEEEHIIRDLKKARKEEHDDGMNEHESIIQQLKEVSEEFKVLHEKNKGQKANLKQLEATYTSTNDQFTKLQKENNDLEIEIQKLQFDIVKKQKQKDKLKQDMTRIVRSEAEVNEFRNQNQQILYDEQEIRDEYESTLQIYNQKKKEIQQIIQELS